MHIIAKAEAKLTIAGEKFVNRELVKTFSDRTLEAIKGMRRKQEYKELVLKAIHDLNISSSITSLHRQIPQHQPSTIQPDEQSTIGPDPHHDQHPQTTFWHQHLREVINTEKFTNMNLDLIVSGQPNEDVREMINEEYDRWINTLNLSNKKRSSQRKQAKLSDNTRTRHRQQYTVTQRLYRMDRSRCADSILSGNWKEQREDPIPLQEMEGPWRDIMEKPSKDDQRKPSPICPPVWSLLDPITPTDIRNTIKKSKKSSPGPDNLTHKQLKMLDIDTLAAHYNLWLYTSSPTQILSTGRTIFIEKELNTKHPLKHRPITISSFIIRIFHKILGQRMAKDLIWNRRQKGFMDGDGVAQNLTLLKTVIKHHQMELKPLSMIFIDVKKAFDSVSHKSMILAAHRLGIPPPLLTYLHEFYTSSSTILTVNNKSSSPILTTRGVRQGDPLSGYLFNMIIDWALSDLDPAIGADLAESKLSSLAYADDVVLFSSTPRGLQSQLDTFCKHLGESGLQLSAGADGKSASLRISIDGRKKKYIVDPTEFLTIANEKVPTLTASASYKYLGINISSLGAKLNVKPILDEGLQNLSQAPLKPQQRLYLLSTYLLPKLYHQLILADVSKSILKWIDNSVRAAVKRWLRLPVDTPRAYFHASAADGGLQIPLMICTILIIRKARYEKLLTSHDPAIQSLRRTDEFNKAYSKITKRITL